MSQADSFFFQYRATLIVLRLVGLALLWVVGILIHPNISAFLGEFNNLSYEVHDDLLKVVDDDSAQRFLDRKLEYHKERFADLKKRIEDFVRLADADDSKYLVEQQKLDALIAEAKAMESILKRQDNRLQALAASTGSGKVQQVLKDYPTIFSEIMFERRKAPSGGGGPGACPVGCPAVLPRPQAAWLLAASRLHLAASLLLRVA